MPRASTPPHLVKKRRQWVAKVMIPADVRAILGRNVFLYPLHEGDPHQAYVKSIPIVAEWKDRIASARAARVDPLQAEIDRFTTEYQRNRAKPLDAAGLVLVAEVIDFMFQRFGGMTSAEQHRALTDARGDVALALQAIPNAPGTLNQIVTGSRATPFLAHLEPWQAASRKSKSLAQYNTYVRQFATEVDQPIERLTGSHVQKWIEQQVMINAPGTVRFKLVGLRKYWSWMQSHELAPIDRNPFVGRKINGQQTAAARAESKRTRFDPLDIAGLWQAAELRGDYDLAAAIRLAIFTGFRLEELAQLRAEGIKTDRATGVRYIHGGLKTEAGPRDIPIHPEIAALVAELAAKRDRGGYLLLSAGGEKWGRRGNALGTRFSKLKKSMGYDRRHVFHSLRYTYAHLLAKSEAPLNVIKDLMGHEGGDVTSGYIGLSGLDQRLTWLEKAIRLRST
jgi:integrase